MKKFRRKRADHAAPRKRAVLETFDGDILLSERADRRILPDVPDPTGQRSTFDRRGTVDDPDEVTAIMKKRKSGIRYRSKFPVRVTYQDERGKLCTCSTESRDISETGILVKMEESDAERMEGAADIRLKFTIPPGSMPEGREMKIRTSARYVRSCQRDGETCIGFEFAEDLGTYMYRRKDRYLYVCSIILLLCISFMVVMMRSESVIYFKYNAVLYSYSIIAAMFLLTRYAFGALYRPVKIDPEFKPSVTIIIPCFNEETWISRTIISCMNQNYPPDKLEVIVVDDCSTDRSVEVIRETIDKIAASEDQRMNIRGRLSYIVQEQNAGKRAALCRGVDVARGEFVIFVDSDSFLDPYAVVNLVQPFRDPKMGGVAGRTDVANTYTNSLTKMQSVRYYIAFRIMKASEALFDTVTCLSGPLSCYRKSIVKEHEEEWLNQKFLGHKATFGDDRAMTNFVLRNHRTYYQDTAVCSTIVPNKQKVFLKQQMRWKRSWLRESLMAGAFMWRKEPFAAVNFYIGLLVPILAPIVVAYNLFYIPFTQHVFPTTFLVGLLLMSLMMSVAQLLFRKSSTWYFGFLFCIYYEVVLLWQMPLAWVTFWKSTWGTRMTPSDVKEKEKRQRRKNGAAADAEKRETESGTGPAAAETETAPEAKQPPEPGGGPGAKTAEDPEEKHAKDPDGQHARSRQDSRIMGRRGRHAAREQEKYVKNRQGRHANV